MRESSGSAFRGRRPTSKENGRRGGKGGEGNSPKVKVSRINTVV